MIKFPLSSNGLKSTLLRNMYAGARMPVRHFVSMDSKYSIDEQYNWAACARILAEKTRTLSTESVNSVAYQGAFSDYYITHAKLQSKNELEAIYIMDNDPKLLQQSHSDMSHLLTSTQKWFLSLNNENIILDSKSTDMIVINNRICCKHTKNIESSINQLLNSLRNKGIILGITDCKDSFEKIQIALEKYGVYTEIYNDSPKLKLDNDVYLFYALKKNKLSLLTTTNS